MAPLTDWPRITVITPSFNQAQFLERTIRSVLDQGYPNLEYMIVDGGSTDGSVEIIQRYEKQLAWWVSEPDRGQADAINKGLRRATGDWVGWQNSDDIYYPGAFHELAATTVNHPKAGLIVGNLMLIDAHDKRIRDLQYLTPNYNALRAEGMLLANQAAFWRGSLHDRLGYLDDKLHYLFDYEWFLRVTQDTQGVHINHIWGALRYHAATKTSTQSAAFESETRLVLAGRELKPWQIAFYKMRRYALLCVHGYFWYVLRGAWRRLSGNIYYKTPLD